ncbi:hypothetical protein RND81_06G236500 [Saponaria officinalis]|uniref:TPX2 central domain-containing protein n=1 Tax=Saponaria officinalis TaxID=3572 RepID=A0AAW1KDT9_SAPOF
MFLYEEDINDVYELDYEYEFDAATFFDFTKLESEAEARVSELWFESAPDYPPSPFAVKLFPMKASYLHNVDALHNSENDDNMSLASYDADFNQQEEHSRYPNEAYQEKRSQVLRNVNPNSHDSRKQAGSLFGGPTGFSFNNHSANYTKKTKTKSTAKPYVLRSSTLMKPTASQLAKQNPRQQATDDSQASKRQKLDNGLLRKIVDMKQPTTLTRKIHRKDVTSPQGMNSQSKLRITIPKEPDLETAHRAERIRRTGNREVEQPTSTFGRFKARPLNKKILDAPVCAVLPKRSSQHVQDLQGFRFKATEQTKTFAFTATPTALHQTRKILTSRGEHGVFRNSKRDFTASKVTYEP